MELEPRRALDNEAKRGHNQMSFPAVVPVKDIQSQNISKTQSNRENRKLFDDTQLIISQR
jgi:hypothetical protein